MKIYCLDTVTRVSKNGVPFTQGAFRGSSAKGDFLFIARCPADFEVMKDYNCNVVFSQTGNYILPY